MKCVYKITFVNLINADTKMERLYMILTINNI